VAATAVAEGVGMDTARVITRRETLKTQAAALRSGGAVAAICDLFVAVIAAAFVT
jgi:hypothetical protein